MSFDRIPPSLGIAGFGAGERDGYPENALESYLAAVAHGLASAELDVQRGRAGQVVLCHDLVTGNGEFMVFLDGRKLAVSGIPLFHDVMAALPPGKAIWQASPDTAGMMAVADAGALPVNDVPGVLATLAGDAPPPRQLTGE